MEDRNTLARTEIADAVERGVQKSAA